MSAPLDFETIDRATITAELWRRAADEPDGVGLDYLLYPHQREIREQYLASVARIWVLCCNRRWGKSRFACEVAVETALQIDGADIKYAAPTQKMARKIVVPHMRVVLADCPAHLQPVFRVQDLTWTFPNGSIITLAGCDGGNADNLRGTSMHLGILDEAGFIDDLDYVVQSVLLPQAMTTGGRVLMLSTPALSPTHGFTLYCQRGEASGDYAHRDIYSLLYPGSYITAAIVDEFLEECGGAESSDWRREYLAETVIDEEAAVCPEFTRERGVIVSDDMALPEYYDAYVSADFGFHDMTAVLFAHWDFDRALICVADEVTAQHTSSGPIIAEVKAKERELWCGQEPYLRVGDCDEMLRRDLNAEHGMAFSAPRKDDKHAAVNALRTAVRQGRLRIHPRCKVLLAHLSGAVWNKSRTKFARAPGFGHFDAVDALVYLVRHVSASHNPFPRFRNGENPDTHWLPPEQRSEEHEAMRAALRPRRTRR